MEFTAPEAISHRVINITGAVVRSALDQPPDLGSSDCEALHAGFFTQPVNTVTSGAFIGVGAWLAARTVALEHGQRVGAATFAALAALNGIGSVAYHGPQFPGSQTLHDVPIYGMLAMGAGVPAWRRLRRRAAVPGWSPAHGIALVAAAVVGGVAYVGGRSASRVCDPDSWIQFHGLWHLATAAATGVWATALWPVDRDDSVVESVEIVDREEDADR